MPAPQQERRSVNNGAPTGFQAALGALDHLDKRKKATLFWFALGLFSFPAIILLIAVIGELFLDPDFDPWVPWVLFAMMIVGGLLLMPNVTLRALDAIARLLTKLSPSLGKIFQVKDRRGGSDASQPNDRRGPTP